MPVGPGVVKVEGSSEVNIVVEDGEMRYLAFRVPNKASRKPVNGQQGRFRRSLIPLTLLPFPKMISDSHNSVRLW